MPKLKLYPYQKAAIEKLHTGSILCAGVGSGKSITSLAYFYIFVCQSKMAKDGELSLPKQPKDLYIITTARKRDTLEWEEECLRFGLSTDKDLSVGGIRVVIDSWNNIQKYKKTENAFFIFDEQRVVGSGSWSKTFIYICRRNDWILLSATPGDTWMDYIPVFIANGFYRNRTDFLQQHAVYDRYSKYPKVNHYICTGKLERLRKEITVTMEYTRPTTPHWETLYSVFDVDMYNTVMRKRWDPFDNVPIQDISKACYLLRKVVNSDESKLAIVRDLMKQHDKIIIFYNYTYELELLRSIESDFQIAEWNGLKHEPIPSSEKWLFLVQYMAGAEGWNCIETNAIIFFSQSYSYKMMAQAAGRIDRMNTKFTDLYYYTIMSKALIDISISRSLKCKKNFNEKNFLRTTKLA